MCSCRLSTSETFCFCSNREENECLRKCWNLHYRSTYEQNWRPRSSFVQVEKCIYHTAPHGLLDSFSEMTCFLQVPLFGFVVVEILGTKSVSLGFLDFIAGYHAD
uniref:Uncharacterized protein n=1 Tax=Rhipicephalus microplus TaxID=6941 RepID=A0A6G5AIT4_RHIMP